MMLAMFRDEAGLLHALDGLRAAGIEAAETFTPAPLAGAPTASPIPGIILAAGLAGAAASFALQAYSSALAYPFDIGGRPDVAWAAFVPTAFENGVLVAVVAAIAAFLWLNRLPRLYDPVDEWDGIRRATRDRWVVQVAGAAPETAALLHRLGAVAVETAA